MVVNINNKTLNVKICITPSEIKNGMMGKRFNSSFNGMLFFLNEGEHNFWMKDCLIPLDIIFINNNKIVEIHHNCPPCSSQDCEFYSGFGNMVLELPGNFSKKNNINLGDNLFFSF